MKGQARVGFCAVILLISGCCSVSSRVDLSPTHYTVTVMILELSKEAEQVLNTSSQPSPEVVSKRWDVKMTRLPTLHVLVGETNAVQRGKSHSYPIECDADGKPTKYGSVMDGLTIQAALSVLPDQRPRLTIAVDDTKITAWSTSPAGNRSPVCRTRRINTTTYPHWGQWQSVGGTAATKENKGQVFLLRLDEPNKEPSNQ
jgi:hypothetical protein